MKSKTSNLIIVIGFCLFIFGFFIAMLALPDKDVSAEERRKLQQVPEFSFEALASGKFTKDADKYAADQFPLRQELRSLKAGWQFNVFRQKDNNGIFLAGGSVCKLTGELDKVQLNALISKVNDVYDTYLSGMRVYFANIPDKSYFAAGDKGYPALDYEALDKALEDGLREEIQYLGYSATQELTLEDYYATDLHWRQECLQSVLDGLAAEMGFSAPDISQWSVTEYSPFFGAYFGQSALNVGHDTIKCLSSAATEASVVTGLEIDGEKAVYDPADFEGLDGYSVFLSGPQALLTVENPQGETGRELYIFRDSFSSSFAPLLLESYDKITLIDLRYMASALLGDFVEFEPGADVLFLYSTEILNNGFLLK